MSNRGVYAVKAVKAPAVICELPVEINDVGDRSAPVRRQNQFSVLDNGSPGLVVEILAAGYPVDNGKKWKYFAKVAAAAYVAAAAIGWLLLH